MFEVGDVEGRLTYLYIDKPTQTYKHTSSGVLLYYAYADLGEKHREDIASWYQDIASQGTSYTYLPPYLHIPYSTLMINLSTHLLPYHCP